MKTIRKQKLVKEKQIYQTQEENRILKSLLHPFIVKLHYAFQTKQKLFLLMEFVNGGELFYHLKQGKRFTEKVAQFYAAQILLGLEYLHSKNIIYRDLKPQNILLDHKGNIKLTDFGLAKEFTDNETQTYTFCGTPEYLAPEIINGKGYNHTVDYWTLGVLIYEMLSGNSPFYSRNRAHMFLNIQNVNYKKSKFISYRAECLISSLLVANPKYRLGARGIEEIKNDIFFAGIDWTKLLNYQIEPPWVPQIVGPEDLTYIDPVYVNESIRDNSVTIERTNNMEVNFHDFTYETVHSGNENQSYKNNLSQFAIK